MPRNPTLIHSENVAVTYDDGAFDHVLQFTNIAWPRVYPDGHEELVRNGELSGVNVSMFKNVLAVSNSRYVFTEPFLGQAGGMATMMSFSPFEQEQTLSTYVVPSLLFEDMSLQPPHGEIPKLPTVPRPGFTD